jgi:hypothetical protein
MNLKMSITWDLDTGDDDLDRRILDIAEDEGRKAAAALADRLEDEGIDDVRLILK